MQQVLNPATVSGKFSFQYEITVNGECKYCSGKGIVVSARVDSIVNALTVVPSICSCVAVEVA